MKSPRKSKKIMRDCVVCGRKIRVFVYEDKKYRGGHYFGKIPIHTKKAMREADKAGTHEVKMGGIVWNVMNKSPKPYKYAEYWECPKCYWRG